MGSQRFPGKMMATLEGHPLIDWVLRRSRASRRSDEVVLATTSRAEDDVLADHARRLDVPVFRDSVEALWGAMRPPRGKTSRRRRAHLRWSAASGG